MKLRSQMLLAGALTLAVPVVGWQSVKQLYVALQQTRVDEQTLKVANMRLALSESSDVTQRLEASTTASSTRNWYAESAVFPIFLDGYDDDWQTLAGAEHRWQSGDDQLSVRAATRTQRLYLFIKVADDNVVYHRPPVLSPDAGEGELPDRWQQLVNGDSVELAVELADGRLQHGLFTAMAPGPVQAVAGSDQAGELAGTDLSEWQGFWTSAAGGYQLEISLPLPRVGAAIAVSLVDVDVPGEPRTRWLGSVNPSAMVQTSPTDRNDALGAQVFYASELVRRRLEGWTTEGVRARLFDAQGWLIADVNKLYTTAENDLSDEAAGSFDGVLDALLFRVFALLVADDLPLLPERSTVSVNLSLSESRREAVVGDEPVTSRYVTEENDRVLGTLAPLGRNPPRAYLLLEANEEHTSAYAGSQLARLFSLLLLVSLLAGCGLLIFAIVLSSRIQRLSREAQLAVSVDGRVSALASSESQDEIGDLSRKLSSLLSRSAQYTQYLEALSSRLSHELRTPLSVVRTSLENLDVDTLDEQSRVLIQRAEGGAAHLGRIIKALVDSTRLEQSVQSVDTQRVDLAQWLQASAELYQQVYPEIHFRVHPEHLPVLHVQASPELLQQAMDKLIDNAISFSSDAIVMLQLAMDSTGGRQQALLTVANRGALIDEAASEQLFDPLVSHRSSSVDEMHLGLGLYIVRLIAEGSGGEAVARNQSGWVVFGLSLPLT